MPTTSTMASRAPTSWKCTVSGAGDGGGPRPRPAPGRWPAPAARPDRAGAAAATMAATLAAARWGGSASVRTCTLVPPMPDRMTVSVSSPQPSTGSRFSIPRTSSRSAPASSRAPRAMSPAMPEKQWNQATVLSGPLPEGTVTPCQATARSSCCGGTRRGRGRGRGRGQPRRSAPSADAPAAPVRVAATRPWSSTRSTAQAAPKPLSMPTTVRPDAHEASMPSSAVTPARPAP